MGTKVITEILRAKFPHLFEARALEGDKEPKFSITALIDKSDTKTLDRVHAAIDFEINKRWGAKASLVKIHSPLHDGDGLKPSSQEPYGPDCYGCYVLNAKSTDAPGVVDANLKPITDPKAISFNDTFRLSLDISTYEKSGRRGVYVALVNVQQVAKGGPKPKRTAAEDFGVVESQTENETEDFLQ